jgi:hypothetical protein
MDEPLIRAYLAQVGQLIGQFEEHIEHERSLLRNLDAIHSCLCRDLEQTREPFRELKSSEPIFAIPAVEAPYTGEEPHTLGPDIKAHFYPGTAYTGPQV